MAQRGWHTIDDLESLEIAQGITKLSLVIIEGESSRTLWDYRELKLVLSFDDPTPSDSLGKTFRYSKSKAKMKALWLAAQCPGTICYRMQRDL